MYSASKTSARTPDGGLHSPLQPPSPASESGWRWQGLHGPSAAMAIAALARRHQGLTVAITATPQHAQSLEQDLQLLRDDEQLPVAHFPDWETLPYDLFSPHPDILSQRLQAMATLPGLRRGLLVVPVSTVLQRLAPVSYIQGRSLILRQGDTLDMDGFRQRLGDAGYENAETVHQSGQYTMRGGLLDVFPAGSAQPLRLEWLDDEIDTIRYFDPETQRSTGTVEHVELLPGREYPFDQTAIDDFRRAFRNRFAIDVRNCNLYQDLRAGRHPQGLEYYLPLFFSETASLFDYLGENPRIIADQGCLNAAEHFLEGVAERYEQRRYDMARPILEPGELYHSLDTLRGQLSDQQAIWLDHNSGDANADDNGQQVIRFSSGPAPQLPLHDQADQQAFASYIREYPGRILLAADSPGRREVLLETLHAFDIRPQSLPDWHAFRAADQTRLAVTVLPVSDGVMLPDDDLLILTESQLFAGRLRQRQKRTSERDSASVIRNLTDLNTGAPVVHEEHGVGRYMGLSVLDVAGLTGEFLTLEYAEGDKLYVPVSDLNLISRYAGGSTEHAPLHKLGNDRWVKTKRKAIRKIRDAAAELLDIYARREAAEGFQFPLERKAYAEFAAGFPYEETPDQQDAIDAVIEDLTAPQVMDRVVCGDVGFGKTEVALRAAFVAANAGRQVAVLAPTTLLVRQHFNLFRDRFADWPINVAMLSRLRNTGEAKKTLEGLQQGSVDIVIGTHRLLQRTVDFKDLGLIIIDEEQRFGVRQKEQLKALRAEVDLLTLTATPIPRTLGMALSGIRDLSIIATPPARRMAVKTSISQWDDSLIHDAVDRELQRGGQVYFLHNEVRTIQAMAARLGKLFPDASIAVAHGQMAGSAMDQIMREFYARKHHILVCTTIIENGIDVPSANTIIINNADHFGLAQLHQLRGRVGRSHHRAFAYLLVPDWNNITRDAQKRLEALSELEDLGAGFALASHDMEIRGAGELLGEEQSGQIEELGFELHLALLERAVEALKSGLEPDLEAPLHSGCEVQLHLPALVPETYLPDVHTRLTLYKRISSADDKEDLRQLQIEMIDRFGLLPQPAKNLFAVATIRLQATAMGITHLELGPAGGWIDFSSTPDINPAALIKLVQTAPDEFVLRGSERLSLRAGIDDDQKRLHYLRELLLKLRPVPDKPTQAS